MIKHVIIQRLTLPAEGLVPSTSEEASLQEVQLPLYIVGLCGFQNIGLAAFTQHALFWTTEPPKDYREYFLPETIQELRRAHEQYDMSGDGVISIKELYQMSRGNKFLSTCGLSCASSGAQ